MKNFKNPHEKKYNDAEKNKNRDTRFEQAADIFSDKPYSEEYDWLYSTATIVGFVAQCITFLGAAAMLHYVFSMILPVAVAPLYTGIIPALTVMMALEYAKRKAINIGVKQYYRYGEVSFIVKTIVLGTMGIGIVLVVAAAVILPEKYIEKPSLQNIKSTTTIEAELNGIAASISANEEKAKNDWNVRNRILPVLYEQRNKLQADLKKSAELDKSGNEAKLADAQKNRAEMVFEYRLYAIIVEVIAEFLGLLCIGFGLYYRYREWFENSKQATEDDTDTPVHTPVHTHVPILEDEKVPHKPTFEKYKTPNLDDNKGGGRQKIGFEFKQSTPAHTYVHTQDDGDEMGVFLIYCASAAEEPEKFEKYESNLLSIILNKETNRKIFPVDVKGWRERPSTGFSKKELSEFTGLSDTSIAEYRRLIKAIFQKHKENTQGTVDEIMAFYESKAKKSDKVLKDWLKIKNTYPDPEEWDRLYKGLLKDIAEQKTYHDNFLRKMGRKP